MKKRAKNNPKAIINPVKMNFDNKNKRDTKRTRNKSA